MTTPGGEQFSQDPADPGAANKIPYLKFDLNLTKSLPEQPEKLYSFDTELSDPDGAGRVLGPEEFYFRHRRELGYQRRSYSRLVRDEVTGEVNVELVPGTFYDEGPGGLTDRTQYHLYDTPGPVEAGGTFGEYNFSLFNLPAGNRIVDFDRKTEYENPLIPEKEHPDEL